MVGPADGWFWLLESKRDRRAEAVGRPVGFAGAVTRRYGLYRQRPGAGRAREAAAAMQGDRPEEAATLPPQRRTRGASR